MDSQQTRMEPLDMPARTFAQQLLHDWTRQRSAAALARLVEQTARDLALAGEAALYVFDEGQPVRAWTDVTHPADALPELARALCATVLESGRGLRCTAEQGEALALPVTHQAQVVAVLVLHGCRTPLHAGLLVSLGEMATTLGAVWQLVSDREQAERLQGAWRDLLVAALEHIEPQRRGRVARLMRLATALGERLDLPRRTMEQVWEAIGYLDLGRVALLGQPPAAVEAFHPVRGAEILRTSRAMAPIAALVAGQGERYDEGRRKPVEMWLLALCTDLERARAAAAPARLEAWFDRFVAERGDRHHHSVLEALQALRHAGQLAEIVDARA